MTPRSRFAATQRVITLLCLLYSLLSIGVHGQSGKVDKLTLYVHEDRVTGPTATLMTVLTPSGNLGEVSFGSIQVFSNSLKDGATSSSAVIGVEPGLVIIGTENVFISYVLTLSTPAYNGTLSVQGQFGFNVWPRELAVVGGTGVFRFATGYDISEIVDDSDLSDYVTIHNIQLKYAM